MSSPAVSEGHWTSGFDVGSIKTPAYVYSVDEVSRCIRALKAALGTAVLISFKACPLLEIISRLPEDCWDGVELASRGELHMFAGHRPRHFYVNTPSLNESLVRSALGAKASLVIDAPSQLSLIDKVRGSRTIQPISLRLSNQLISYLCPEAPRLRPDQFGMDLEIACECIETARCLGIDVDGVHLFAGPNAFGRVGQHVVAAVERLLPMLEQHLNHPLRIANLGGGLEEDWAEKSHDFRLYRTALSRLPPTLEIIHEFGRAIFAPAGVFATRVVSMKRIAGRLYAVCDGGIAQAFLLAGTENFLRRQRRPQVANRSSANSLDSAKTIIVGSSCSQKDVIGETTDRLMEGDVLLFDGCGAYFRTYSMNGFLSLSEPAVYVF